MLHRCSSACFSPVRFRLRGACLMCLALIEDASSFSVYSEPPFRIINALWPLSISSSKPIKVSSNQEMVSAVVSCCCSYSSPSGCNYWSRTCTVLYIVWSLRERKAISFCLRLISFSPCDEFVLTQSCVFVEECEQCEERLSLLIAVHAYSYDKKR